MQALEFDLDSRKSVFPFMFTITGESAYLIALGSSILGCMEA